MSVDDVLRPVFEVFEAELREEAPRVADALIALASAPTAAARKELMDGVYRYAHSMKGNAGTLGLEDLQELAHAMESLLQPYRGGERPLPPELADGLLAAADLCPERVAAALSGAEGRDEGIARAAEGLARLAQGAAARAQPEKEELPASSAPSPSGRRASDLASAQTLRVSMERLIRLDRILDDLRDGRGALEQRAEELRRLYWLIEEAVAETGGEVPGALKAARDCARELARGLGFEVTELGARLTSADDELRQLRMLPVDTVISALPRAVWEHARREGKNARVVSTGTEVALDRRILDELRDPLVHLVRNAVDHGLERPEERERCGKSAEGVLRIDVEQREAHVVLTVSDDGRGIDPEALRKAAVKKGFLSPEAASGLDGAQALELLFAPGFSTASEVSMTSGRGVGLDVVRERVQRVGGKVTVSTEPGAGTRFLLEVPLTLATAQVLLVQAGADVVGLPLSAVHSAHFVHPARVGAATTLEVEGQPLPLHALAALLGGHASEPGRRGFPVVVLKVGERLSALRVERLLGERELVLRPLPQELQQLRHLSSAASSGDGRVVFVLHPRVLSEQAQDRASGAARAPQGLRKRVLVADDSITTRALHRQVLEAAGFEVETASDGEDALRQLGGAGSFDLLVSDVRMPKLDGVALTERLRRDERHRALPVVLVSSQDSDEDRLRAEAAGASALLGKAAYERGELLRLIQELLTP